MPTTPQPAPADDPFAPVYALVADGLRSLSWSAAVVRPAQDFEAFYRWQ